MKNLIIFLTIFIVSITISSAQNPYSQFGCKAGVLQTEQEKSGEYDFVAIANDTNSEIQILHFNLVNMEYIAFNAKGEMIKSGKIVIEIPKRWMSIDPLSSEFPDKSPYNFVSNNPINRIDPDGKADYYKSDGQWAGNDLVNDNRTMLTDGVLQGPTPAGQNDSWRFKGAQDLHIGHDIFLGFAAAINQETGGGASKDEALAIGNTLMNIANQGPGSLKTLDDLVMYDNSVVQGATLKNYQNFLRKSISQRNKKYAITSALNAIGFDRRLTGFQDYSGGADAWDGKDLVKSNLANSHRKYKWTNSSMSILQKYSQMYGSGVDVTKFTYTDVKPTASALKIVGETVFEDILTPLGGRKQDFTRFFK